MPTRLQFNTNHFAAMHQVDCDDFLRQESPDAWVLAILCDFKGKLPRDIRHYHKPILHTKLRRNAIITTDPYRYAPIYRLLFGRGWSGYLLASHKH